MSVPSSFDTLQGLLRRNALQFGGRAAMQYKRYGVWVPFSWMDYLRKVEHISLGLSSIGVRQGDFVLLIGDNAPEWYFSELAVHTLRGISVGLHPGFTKDEIAALLKGIRVRFAIVQNVEQVQKLLEIKGDLPSLERVILWEERGLGRGRNEAVLLLAEIEKMGEKLKGNGLFEHLLQEARAEDPCTVLFTSGITGEPKAVLHTHRSMVENASRYLRREGWRPGDKLISPLPPSGLVEKWFCLVGHLMSGSTLYIAERPETFFRDMGETQPTVVFFGAKVWEGRIKNVEKRIAQSDRLKRFTYRLFMGRQRPALRVLGELLLFGPLRRHLGLSQARLCYNTGPLLARGTMEFYHKLGVPLKHLYWTCETGIICCPRDGFDWRTVGHPLDGIEVEVLEDGELRIRADHPLGYYLSGGKAIDVARDGYFWPGDVARWEDRGIVLVDRREDAIRGSGGELFSSQWVEGLLRLRLPYLEDAYVFQAEDGDVLCTVLLLSESNLRRWLQDMGLGRADRFDAMQDGEFLSKLEGALRAINEEIGPHLRIQRYTLLSERSDLLNAVRLLRKSHLRVVLRDLVEELKKGEGLERVDMDVRIKSLREDRP